MAAPDSPIPLNVPGGSYLLREKLGRGQFGVVWRAEAPGGVEVAVKIIERTLKPQEAERELQALHVIRKLRHPFLLSLQAFYSLDDRLIIVLELADGNLRSLLNKRRAAGATGLSAGELLSFFREAAEALDYLHAHNVQHRDVKPDNLLLLGSHLKVADCGLARLAEEQSLQTASTIGTPAYMAPEVWNESVHPHSDQYSLAVTYAELRAGKFPFASNSLARLMHAHLNEAPNLVFFDAAEQDVLRQGLAKDPRQRFASCGDFIGALAAAASWKEVPAVSLVGGPISPAPLAQDRESASPPEAVSSLRPPKAAAATAVDIDTVAPSAKPAPPALAAAPAVLQAPGSTGQSPLWKSLVPAAVVVTSLLIVVIGWSWHFSSGDITPEHDGPIAQQKKESSPPNSSPTDGAKEDAKVEDEPKSDPAPPSNKRDGLEKQLRLLLPPTAKATERLKEPVDSRLAQLRAASQTPAFEELTYSQRERVAEVIKEIEDYLEYKKALPTPPLDVASIKTDAELDAADKLVQSLRPPVKYDWSELPPIRQRQDWIQDLQALRSAATAEEKKLRSLLQGAFDLNTQGESIADKKWLDRKAWLEETTALFKKEQRLPAAGEPVPGAANLAYRTVLAFEPVAVAHKDWTKLKAALKSQQGLIPSRGMVAALSLGHTHQITSVALSADGKRVLTGSMDKTAIQWDAATGKPLKTFAGHTASVNGVALSADGKLVVTGSDDRSAILWDAATAKQLKTFGGHEQSVTCVALASDGKRVLTGSWDKTAVLWDAATGKQVKTFAGHAASVTSVAISGDGKLVVTGSDDRTAILWDVATGELLKTFEGHKDWGMSVALSADGKQMLTGSSDKTAILWDTGTGKQLKSFQGQDIVKSVALSTDAKQVLTGSSDAILWDAATGEKLRTFKGHEYAVSSVALWTEGKQVLTGSADGSAVLWDVVTGKQLKTFEEHEEFVRSGALSADGKQVLTGSHDKTAILWDAATGKQLKTFEGHEEFVSSVALSADGKQVLTGSDDKTAILWDAATGKQVKTFEGHEGSVGSVALSADGKQVLTGSHDKTAILWDAATGKQVKTFEGHEGSVRSVALSADGKQVLTGSDDKTAILWDAATGKQLKTFEGHEGSVGSVALSADGKQVLTGSHDETAILWDAVTGKQLKTFEGHKDWVWSVALSADGKQVLTGSADKTAILWNAATGKQLKTFEGHKDWVWSVALSADAKNVWTGSDMTRLWNVATGKEVCAFISREAGKEWLVVTPEGFFDGTPGAWPLLGWREVSTGEVFTDDATRNCFRRPNLLADYWKILQP